MDQEMSNMPNNEPAGVPQVAPEQVVTEQVTVAEAGPVVLEPEKPKKKSNGMLLGLILCLLLAAGGIGFGVWAMMDGNTQKANFEKQISDLKAQNSKLLEQIAALQEESDEEKNDDDGGSSSSSDVDPEDYIYVGEWGVKIKIPENLIGKIGYIFSGNNYLDVTDYASNYTYGEQMDWVKSNVLKIVRSKSGEVDFENCHQSCTKLITALDGYDYSYVLSGSNIELLQSTALNDMVKPDSFSRI